MGSYQPFELKIYEKASPRVFTMFASCVTNSLRYPTVVTQYVSKVMGRIIKNHKDLPVNYYSMSKEEEIESEQMALS